MEPDIFGLEALRAQPGFSSKERGAALHG